MPNHIPKIPNAIALAALLYACFFWPASAQAAACCICTHQQIKGGKFCIQGAADCMGLNSSVNKELANSACSEDKSANPCKKTTAGGKCLNDPSDEISFKLSSVPGYSAEQPSTPASLPVQLNIDIPGLTFFAPYKDSDEIIVPMLAQYIQAFQKTLIGISLVAAAIMLVYGGWLYIISGTGIKVREGKKIITDALIGMIITLGAVVILSNINPNTASMSALHLYVVPPQPYSLMDSKSYGSAVSMADGAYKSDLDKIPIDKTAVMDFVEKKAKEMGLNPCIAKKIIESESGTNPNAVGHNENWYDLTAQERTNFLRQRVLFSKNPFPSDTKVMPGECNAGTPGRAACESLARNGPRNDDPDVGDPSKPDLGLDWRWSHDLGLGQINVGASLDKDFAPRTKSSWCKPGVPSSAARDKCFSWADLFTVKGGVEAILNNPSLWKKDGTPQTDLSAIASGYVGSGCGPGCPQYDKKLKLFTECPK